MTQAMTAAAAKKAHKTNAARTEAKSVSKLVTQLLTGSKHLDYAEIAERVRRRIPSAHTTPRSVASLATGLRAAGIELPDRRTREARTH